MIKQRYLFQIKLFWCANVLFSCICTFQSYNWLIIFNTRRTYINIINRKVQLLSAIIAVDRFVINFSTNIQGDWGYTLDLHAGDEPTAAGPMVRCRPLNMEYGQWPLTTIVLVLYIERQVKPIIITIQLVCSLPFDFSFLFCLLVMIYIFVGLLFVYHFVRDITNIKWRPKAVVYLMLLRLLYSVGRFISAALYLYLLLQIVYTHLVPYKLYMILVFSFLSFS